MSDSEDTLLNLLASVHHNYVRESTTRDIRYLQVCDGVSEVFLINIQKVK